MLIFHSSLILLSLQIVCSNGMTSSLIHCNSKRIQRLIALYELIFNDCLLHNTSNINLKMMVIIDNINIKYNI